LLDHLWVPYNKQWDPLAKQFNKIDKQFRFKVTFVSEVRRQQAPAHNIDNLAKYVLGSTSKVMTYANYRQSHPVAKLEMKKGIVPPHKFHTSVTITGDLLAVDNDLFPIRIMKAKVDGHPVIPIEVKNYKKLDQAIKQGITSCSFTATITTRDGKPYLTHIKNVKDTSNE